MHKKIMQEDKSIRDQIRKGSTETILLMLLAERPMYGYEICKEMAERSNGYFDMKEGLLYPTLHRMQKQGLLSSEWQQTDSGRRRKYYTVTADGRVKLGHHKAEWNTFMVKFQEMLS